MVEEVKKDANNCLESSSLHITIGNAQDVLSNSQVNKSSKYLMADSEENISFNDSLESSKELNNKIHCFPSINSNKFAHGSKAIELGNIEVEGDAVVTL